MGKQQTKTVPDFPKALYGCEDQGCAEEASHFPEDLWLILNPPKGWDPGWYCEGCADEACFQNPDTQTGETLEHYLGLERDKDKAELLEALKAIHDRLKPFVVTYQHQSEKDALRWAKEAIAKAEGKQCTTPK